jgi:hypothetical protein
MPADRYLRCGDDQPVEALAYSGANADEVRAWLVGYRVTDRGEALVVTRDQEDAGLEVRPGDWLVRDDERVALMRAYEFFGRYRAQPVE